MDNAPPTEPHVTYSQEHRRCGKATCATCRDGLGHGPYWYAVWREGRRVRRRYLGVTPPPGLESRQAVAMTSATGALLRVRTLGNFVVWCAGIEVPRSGWRRRKAGSLLKVLLAAPGYALPREQAQEQLWPEAESAAAARDLHGALHALRKLLGEAAGCVSLEGDMLRLEAPHDGSWLDAEAFETATSLALAGHDLDASRAALALYTGDYLPGDPYEEWALVRRETLRAQHLTLLLHVAELCSTHGDPEEAERRLRLVLAHDPCHEDATAHLMGVLAGAGRRVEALKAYEELSVALARELGVTPSSDTAALYQRLLAQSAAPVAAARSPRHEAVSRPTNLPVPLTSFVGRAAEQGAVRALLEEVRLLTLIGAGGCGKTRLAVHVADGLVDRYADGVWLVELAATGARDIDLAVVSRALAAVLGVAEEPDKPLITTLAEFLAPRRILLVVDNCEHVIAPCADLVSGLLSACPALRILATGRAALGVPGEALFRVTPLAAPPADVGAAELPAYEAAALFLERARACRPDFAATPATATDIAQICIRLDGIPLAIELAAARVAVLSVETVARRLDDCFRLLTGGPRTVLPRQRTLRATLDWSYTLLRAPERTLLRRLAVFTAGWTLDAAEAVCADQTSRVDDGDSGVPVVDLLDLLSDLVGKSLVQVADRRGTVRYRFLEPIRQYALDLLDTAGEAAVMCERHLKWAIDLAEQAEPALWEGAHQGIWLERLETEHENCRAALRWAIANGRPEGGLRLAAAIRQFWDVRGYRQEGWDWLEALLALEQPCDAVVRAKALIGAANLAYGVGAYEQASRRAEQGHILAQEHQYPLGVALSLNVPAMIAADKDDLTGAETLYGEALALFRSLGDRRRMIGVIGNLGNIAYFRRDFQSAIDRYEEVALLTRPLGDAVMTSQVLANMGSILTEVGDLDRAEVVLEESLLYAREAGAIVQTANALTNLADVALTRGTFERAAELAQESMVLHQRSGDRRSMVGSIVNIARSLVGLGRYERAAILCGATAAGLQALGASSSGPEWDGLRRAGEVVQLRLGHARFAAAYGRGRAMSLEQASTLSLDVSGN